MIDRFGVSFIAWVILPEHIHWLIRPGDADYSKVVFSFKRSLGAHLRKLHNLPTGPTVWHDRFWEHTVKDQDDLNRIVEYIHFNPVKHKIVKSPSKWEFSSFPKYVKRGIYPADWAEECEFEFPGAEYDDY